MKAMRMLFTGLFLGLVLGLWTGVNIGKGHPLLGNPFAKENLSRKLKVKVGESIEKFGEDIKGKPKSNANK